MGHMRRMRTFVRLCVVALALASALAITAVAQADSANLVVSQSVGGPSDPAAGLPRLFTVSGVSSAGGFVIAKYRAVGGAPCAPTASGDAGTWLLDGANVNSSVNGAFSIQQALTWSAGSGAFVFCIWIVPTYSAYDIVTPITQTITFRSPTGAISATVNPVAPQPNQAAVITVSGSSEASKQIFADVRPAGAGATCAPTYSADEQTNNPYGLINGDAVNGTFSENVSYTWTTPGTYLICLWLADSSSDTTPIAGPQPETVIVAVPAPPIKVSGVITLGCAHLTPIANFYARNVNGVCIQYAFTVAPRAGQHATVAFVSPAHTTVRKVNFTWTSNHKLVFVAAKLPRSAYLHHHGKWQVILLIDGKLLKSRSFLVQ
jgi:hypothetical protein